MKKAVILALVIALLAAPFLAADEVVEQQGSVPATVQNRLSIEFHAVSGDDRVTLNLPDYFGRKANFVAAPAEHVDVEIDANGVATLSAKDPNWRGIEEIVFAVSEEYLEEKKKEEAKRRYVQRNLSAIASKDKIALISDAFTQEQYETIVGRLTPEPVVIAPTLTDDKLELDLNKEVTISFSSDKKEILPRVQMDFHTKEQNITLADYKELSDTLFLALFIIGVGTALILAFYLRYMFTGPLKPALFAEKKKVAPSRTSQFKGEAASKLKDIRRRIGKDSPAKLYKETLMVMNSFIAKAFRVSRANLEMAGNKLDNYGITGSLKSDILSYLIEYREVAYRDSDIKREDVENLIRFAESIINRL